MSAGIPGDRAKTANVDIVLLLRLRDIAALRQAFPDDLYYVPSDETLRLEAGRDTRGLFILIHRASQFKADIYLAARDPLHAWALKHRRRIDIGGATVWIAPPEYVILRKLEYLREGARDKHVRDVRYMLAATVVDRDFLATEVARQGLGIQWAVVQPD